MNSHIMLPILFLFIHLQVIYSLENGVARTPPMGWSAWVALGYGSCASYDKSCLSDAGIRNTANLLVSEGYAEAGYEYIIIDDGWQERQRDENLQLQPNRTRFPYGIRSITEYIHNRNLKCGIFSDLGPQTGMSLPGTMGNLERDAQTFANWEVDYVKMSAASLEPHLIAESYQNFGASLTRTNRKIVYATSWPVYQIHGGLYVNFDAVARTCNTWRFGGDMSVNGGWQYLLAIMDHYAKNQETLGQKVGPGAWNDADLLVVGVSGYTVDQAKVQMAIWSIMPSPLIFSTRIENLSNEHKAILQNRNVIAVNQDSLGKPGYKCIRANNIDVWLRQISPKAGEEYSYAVAFVNRNEYGTPENFTIALNQLGLNNVNGYSVTDLFSTNLTYNGTTMLPSSIFTVQINPSGVVFLKAEIRVVNTVPLPYNNEIIRYKFSVHK